MLELIFRGFLEWIYVLLVEIWEFIAGGLLDIMGLDFAYLQTHIPIMDDMARVLMAAGWALLLGNLVFQALKSMAAGLGFEGEDPKLLFARTFVFAFLLLASPQICRIGLDLTSSIMDLLSIPDATNVSLVDESVFGTLTASWLMAIICSVIVMFKVLGLLIEIAERYVILAMLTLTAPLAFAMGGSKNTASIFTGWCRMFGSMCLLMVTNLVCFKMLFSVVSTVPSGLDVLPWMVLIFAIVKVAKKSDAIITRIGLNPAITGGPGRTLPGMLAYTVVRTAVSGVAKGFTGGGFGGGRTAGASASGTRTGSGFSGSRFGSRFSAGGGGRFGSARGGGRSSGGPTSGNEAQGGERPGGSFGGGRGGGRSSGSQTSGDSSQNFGGSRGGGRYTYHSTGQQSSAQQTSTRQENSSQASAQQKHTSSAAANTARGGGRPQQTRRSSVPPGTGHPHSYVPPSGAANTPAPGAAGSGSSQRPGRNGTESHRAEATQQPSARRGRNGNALPVHPIYPFRGRQHGEQHQPDISPDQCDHERRQSGCVRRESTAHRAQTAPSRRPGGIQVPAQAGRYPRHPPGRFGRCPENTRHSGGFRRVPGRQPRKTDPQYPAAR